MSAPLNETPLVTVVVPAYNYAHFVGQTIESVQAQTLREWECIVVDDGSTDNTREVVESYVVRDSRVRYVYQQNAGLSAARNTGIREGSGQYVQFLDADDWLEHDKLSYQADFLAHHPEVDIVYGEVRYFITENPQVRYRSIDCTDCAWMPEASGTGEELLRTLLTVNIMPVNCPLVRRPVFDAVGFFDEELRAVEDWHFWIRCAISQKVFRFAPHPGTLALVRTHAQSMSKSLARMFTAILLLRNKVAPLLPTPALRKLNRELSIQEEAVWGIMEGQAHHFAAGFYRLLRAGVRGRKPKWLLYAVILPLMVNPKLRPLISRLKSRLRGVKPAPSA